MVKKYTMKYKSCKHTPCGSCLSTHNNCRPAYCVKKVKGKAFVVGCTTNPGDCKEFQNELDKSGVDVFYNPEFIAQGTIINDLRTADMVLIGGKRNESYDQLCEIYNRIQETSPKISIMSTTAAELVKLAVNCFLTTKISYANMVGQVMALSGMEEEIPTGK